MPRLALIAVPLLLCAACSRQEPLPPPEPAPAPASAPATATDGSTPAPAPAAMPADPAASFDTGAYAGTFAGSGQRLELHADGSYGLETPQGVSQGTWTHEAATGSIRLDPGSKTAEDRVLRMDGNDRLADAASTLTRQAMP